LLPGLSWLLLLQPGVCPMCLVLLRGAVLHPVRPAGHSWGRRSAAPAAGQSAGIGVSWQCCSSKGLATPAVALLMLRGTISWQHRQINPLCAGQVLANLLCGTTMTAVDTTPVSGHLHNWLSHIQDTCTENAEPHARADTSPVTPTDPPHPSTAYVLLPLFFNPKPTPTCRASLTLTQTHPSHQIPTPPLHRLPNCCCPAPSTLNPHPPAVPC
jgi:hypothetical protein